MKKNDLYNKTLEEICCVHKDIRKKVNIDCSIMGVAVPITYFNLESLLVILSFCCIMGKTVSNLIKDIKFMLDYANYYKNSKEYLDAYSCYKTIVEEVSILCNYLNWDNEIKMFAGYSYLLKRGYLSEEHKFYYSRDADYIRDLLGSNVITGVGNCKHINSMLRDLLRENGYLSYNLSMLLDNDVIRLNQMEFLNLGDENNSIDKLEFEFVNEFSKFEEAIFSLIDKFSVSTNHLVTLFIDDTHSYVMDATNDTLFLVDDKLNLYQEKNKFDKCYESFCNEGEKQNLNKMLKPSSIQLLSSRLEDYANVWNSCFELTDIFGKFYKEHKDLYRESVLKNKILVREYDKYNILRK